MSVQNGTWVKRERRGRAHFIESVVAGDAVTECGRRMSDEPTKSGGKLVIETDRWNRCAQCYGIISE